MADQTLQQSAEGESAKNEVALLDVLRLLIDTGKARATSDLVKYATQYGAPVAVEHLRVLEAEGIPIDLAYDAISVHLRVLAFKRSSALLAASRGQKVGLILPLPPHIAELFLPVADVVFLQPGDGAVQGALHQYASGAVKGARACRVKAQEMYALVFEAFREGGDIYVEVPVAEVLEAKQLPQGVRLLAHLRPHRNPGDVKIAAEGISFI